MSDRFTVALRADDTPPVMELIGQIDGDAESELLAAWARAAGRRSRVVLDFSRTEYINSTGLALIVRILADARAERSEVHARGLSDHYREIFEITRLADFLTLDDDLPVVPA
jgi:anti-anti-sigma factor